MADLDALHLKGLTANREVLLALCLRLEEVADVLSSPTVGEGDFAQMALDLKPHLEETQSLEESLLFPEFDRHAGSCFGAMLVEQLKAEHRYDRLAAEELSQTLQALAEGRSRLALATITAMMRGFAENLRRHVHSEDVLIETLLAARAEGREIFA